MVNFGQAAVGIILILITIGGLLYVFYSRTNAVEKTGYGSLIMLTLVSLMIPAFWILENNGQTTATNQQHVTAVQRGMMLYAQYCIDKCYAIDKDGKLVNPKYNGFTLNDMNSMSDDQLRRVISAGIYAPGVSAPTNPSLIVQGQEYGGPLSTNDVEYLFQFLRSADPEYLAKNGFTGDTALNGFTKLPTYLQTNSPSAYASAQALGTLGQFGAPVDMTKQKAVTINIANTATGQTCNPSCYDPLNVKVKVGTIITWVNKSSVGHTVSAIVGESTASPKIASQVFDSGLNRLIPTNGTFTWTATQAAYNFNTDHGVVYYCQVHPGMLAKLTIVP
jgi:plastocyanin